MYVITWIRKVFGIRSPYHHSRCKMVTLLTLWISLIDQTGNNISIIPDLILTLGPNWQRFRVCKFRGSYKMTEGFSLRLKFPLLCLHLKNDFLNLHLQYCTRLESLCDTRIGGSESVSKRDRTVLNLMTHSYTVSCTFCSDRRKSSDSVS